MTLDTSIIQPGACDPRAPHSYPRRVLVAVSGLSPQVLTETIYALTQSQSPAWVPTEVHLLTTLEGAHRARLALLSEDLGWFRRLCADYELQGIQFDASHIHVLQTAAGEPLNDIRTVEDNSAAADTITAKLRELSADPACALHVSIAGGRKSMGFYVGYALSLYGRPQDRLSHVLISNPYESSLDFFYPTRQSRVIEVNGQYADTRDANVTLAHIPFVSLRHGLPEALLQGSASFNDTVEAARAALSPPEVRLNLRKRLVTAGGVSFKLSPATMAMLAVFARRAQQQQGEVSAPHKEVPDMEWASWYLAEHARCTDGDWASSEATQKALAKGMDGRVFSTTLTRLHRVMRAALGPAAAAYKVHDGGSRPRKYALRLDASAIQFVG